jgi:hypothetical protein
VLNVASHPYSEVVQVHLDLAAVPESGRLSTARIEIRDPAGNEIVSEAVALAAGAPLRRRLPLPKAAQGRYTLATFLSAEAGCAERAGPRAEFEIRRFGWEHNRLGREALVIPPLTPLRVDGHRVEVVLREYLLDDLGLPAQITSDGAPLLAAPVALRIHSRGRELTPTASETVAVRSEGEARVRAEATWVAGPIRGRVSSTFEVDGMVWLELELESREPTRLDALDLRIPLRAKQASLFNAITDATIHHRIGEIPPGSGIVWDSTQVDRLILDPEFVPYVWIGNEARGVAWFAESTKGWLIEPGVPLQEIRRRDGAVELLVHFASRGQVLEGRRRVAFGIQATPTKPRPEVPRPWRAWQLECRTKLPFFRLCPLPAGGYWGAATAYGSLFPLNRDYSLLEAFGRFRAGRPLDAAEIERWLEARRADLRDVERSRGGLRYMLSMLRARPDAVVAYANAQASAWSPEFSVYRDEWRPQPFGDHRGGDASDAGEIKVTASASWNDYFLHHLERLLRTGAFDGFVFDMTHLRASHDEVGGPAYRDEAGRLHPGVPIRALRDLLRRAQTLVYRERGAWLNVSHMTTTPVSPVQTWAGVSVGGELKYGLEDYQDRFSREFLRAGALGAQSGTVPVFLPGLRGETSPAERTRLERSLAGVTALHEIRVMARMEGPLRTVWETLVDFGYGTERAAVHRYYDPEPGFTLTGADAEALVLTRAQRALALVVSYGAAGDVELRFEPPSPLEAGRCRCRDVERRGRAPDSLGAGCRVRLARHDFRLVECDVSTR